MSISARIASVTVILVSLIIANSCKRSEESGQEKELTDKSAGAVDPTAVLAKIDDTVITVGEFEQRIARQSPYVRGRYSSLEHKKEFLNNMIRFEVLAIEAKRRGIDKDPDAIRAAKQVMTQKLIQEEFAKTASLESISEAEIRAYYQANTSLYNKPEEVRVAAIIVRQRSLANKVAQLAKSAQGSTNHGFRNLVNAHSIDESSRKSGGDLGYFSRSTKNIPDAVVDAAMDIKKTGDVAGPIAANGKFYIIKQTGKRKPVSKPLEKVSEQIRNRLYREKRRKLIKSFVSQLKNAATIQIDEANLRKVRLPTTSSTTGGGHGENSTLPAMQAAPATSPNTIEPIGN